MAERTLAIVKPDGVEKRLIGAVIGEYEQRGLTLEGITMLRLTKERAEAFYEVHKERSFFGELVEFMTRGRIVPMAWSGPNAVETVRDINGATNPDEARWGTIRRMWADDVQCNIVHASDSPDTAEREVAFYFPELA